MPSSPPVRLVVRLTARGGRDGVEGWGRDDSGLRYLKARVAAPPVEGAANRALREMIAKRLKRPGGSVRIVAGEQGRLKHLEIEGVSPSELHRAFGSPPSD